MTMTSTVIAVIIGLLIYNGIGVFFAVLAMGAGYASGKLRLRAMKRKHKWT